MEGKLKYKGENHFLIIGWSISVQKTIENILFNKDNQTDIVLIDHLKEAPFEHERFHYICGTPTDKEVLQQANIDAADSVAVFADEIADEVLRDGKTLLITSAIEEYAVKHEKQIYTIAEIVHEDHIRMFEHANVDEFVLSAESFPHLMAKALLHHGSSQLFTQLISRSSEENMWEIQPSSAWKTYGEAFEALEKQGANLIADGHDLGIVRRQTEQIPKNARLYIICNEETYRRLKLS